MFDPAGLPAELTLASDPLGARLEDAGLSSSQPPQQTIYDGWLLRYSPGKAKRARSVNTIGPGRLPLEVKLAHVESFYHRAGLPALYRITPYTQPAGLDTALAAAGYVAGDESRVMWTELLRCKNSALPSDASVTDVGAAAFADIVAALRGSPAAQAAAERQRLANSILPGHFVVLRDGQEPLACGCVVVDEDVAGIFNMVTTPEQRCQGHATAIVERLLQHASAAGARWAYLQVDATNSAARRVYDKFGFRDRYAYWYRARPPQGELQ
ncbi:MAG: acetyltransferase [Burkholderiaceae bacterium]|jgi:ribosomal protein S18 acetylase RimI-like enzyme|nr:acetyltransferase [Burkholderiaceae bacterium]